MVVVAGNYCPASGKECFDSRYLAQKAIHRLDSKSSKNGSVYLCPDCGKWHITHHSYRDNKDLNSKKKRKMAGKGKFKIGAEVGFVDNLGNPLVCGAYVRHTITENEGTITQYGVVKGADGTNYRLCDNLWEVVDNRLLDISVPECDLEVKEVKKDIAVVENKVSGKKELAVVLEKTLSDFDDKALADELRARGYEVKAEKTIVVSL